MYVKNVEGLNQDLIDRCIGIQYLKLSLLFINYNNYSSASRKILFIAKGEKESNSYF